MLLSRLCGGVTISAVGGVPLLSRPWEALLAFLSRLREAMLSRLQEARLSWQCEALHSRKRRSYFLARGIQSGCKSGGDGREVSLTVDFSCQNLPVSRTTTLGPSRHTNSTSPVMPTAVFSALLPKSVLSSLFAFRRTEVSTHEGKKIDDGGAKRGHCGSDAAGGRMAAAAEADGLGSHLRGRYRLMLQSCS